MGWNGAEAWIFMSIGDAARSTPATLDKVIGMADSNNHSIPNIDEFELAVSQLLGAGYVTAAAGLYGLTESGRRMYEKINSTKRGHITRFVETAEQWRRKAPSGASPVTWTVSPDEFHQALEEYHRWFSATYEKLKKRNP
ncbi:MAG: hypothetical protein ACHQ50_13725 [Fimbriimonadales bacterium]